MSRRKGPIMARWSPIPDPLPVYCPECGGGDCECPARPKIQMSALDPHMNLESPKAPKTRRRP
jgi:hypothetical protein